MTASLPTSSTLPGPAGRPGHGGGTGLEVRQHLAVIPGGLVAAGPSPLRLVAQPEGLLQIHTAPFRGSFAAVLSQALRTAGLGSRVLISQFLKGGVEQGLAHSPWLCGRLQWLRPAVPACLSETAASSPEACAAVQEIWAFSREQLLAGAVDLMVLDELALAVQLGYVALADVLQALEARPAHLDVILTGPAMAPELMALADQVTQLRRGL
jgi:cob(I)alamin adenosyltransferase